VHGLEQGRAKGLCPKNVASLYDNLLDMYSRHNYLDTHIWNRDESRAQAAWNARAAFIIPNFCISKGRSFRHKVIIRRKEHACMAMQQKGLNDMNTIHGLTTS
jgi:hypothetical protein